MEEEVKVIIASFFTYGTSLRFDTNIPNSHVLINLRIQIDIWKLRRKISSSENCVKSTKCTFFVNLFLGIPILVVWTLPVDTFGEKDVQNNVRILVSTVCGSFILLFTLFRFWCCHCRKNKKPKHVISSLVFDFNTTRK